MRISQQGWIGRVLAVALALTLASPAFAQSFNWQQAKGTQLRVVLNKHPWQAAIETHFKDFEALTGIKLVAEVYPEDQFRAKVLVELTSGAGTIDVFMSMPAQEGLKYMRAGWLQPVDDAGEEPGAHRARLQLERLSRRATRWSPRASSCNRHPGREHVAHVPEGRLRQVQRQGADDAR
jgi:hypothetical protein